MCESHWEIITSLITFHKVTGIQTNNNETHCKAPCKYNTLSGDMQEKKKKKMSSQSLQHHGLPHHINIMLFKHTNTKISLQPGLVQLSHMKWEKPRVYPHAQTQSSSSPTRISQARTCIHSATTHQLPVSGGAEMTQPLSPQPHWKFC